MNELIANNLLQRTTRKPGLSTEENQFEGIKQLAMLYDGTEQGLEATK